MGVPSIADILIVDGSTVDIVASEALLQDANFFTTTNWTIAGGALARTVTGVAAPASNIARLTLSLEMLTGETLTVEPDVSIVSLSTGDNFSPPNEDWAAIGDMPQVASALATSSNVVRLTFNEAMNPNAALSEPNNYTIEPDLGGVSVEVQAVTPEAVAFPTYVDLTLSVEMTDGVDYEITVDTSLTDRVGNTMDPTASVATFAGQGTLPTVTAAEMFDGGRRWRVHFSEPMLRGGALTSDLYYSFTVLTAGAAPVFVERVVAPSTPTYPEYVDVYCSEMTDGANYELVVSTLGPTDRAHNHIDPTGDTVAIVGVGEVPTLSRVEAISANRVNVIFSESMRDNVAIREASRYTWDNGLETVEVIGVEGNIVQLVTTDQTPGTLYNLTIDPT